MFEVRSLKIKILGTLIHSVTKTDAKLYRKTVNFDPIIKSNFEKKNPVEMGWLRAFKYMLVVLQIKRISNCGDSHNNYH